MGSILFLIYHLIQKISPILEEMIMIFQIAQLIQQFLQYHVIILLADMDLQSI